MIQPIPRVRQVPAWQRALGNAITTPAELVGFLRLDPGLPSLGLAALREFPLRVPRAYAARMVPGDAEDPLFLQVWPQVAEGEIVAGFALDAVGDLARLRAGGIVHKYEGRALVIATGACAVHCRYCFRRHFPYADTLAARDHWQAALTELAADRSIEEVILSGGDPLSLADDKLAEFAGALEFLPHVRRLRIHTRQPVVLPERVDDALLGWLGRGRLQKVVVLHANHAQELDDAVAAATQRLRAAGVTLLNQAVLLRRVNDSADAQRRLSQRLFEIGVLPYYLHQLDRVQGAAHFEVPDERALVLMREVAASLPGYLVPRLVREEAGAPGKTALL